MYKGVTIIKCGKFIAIGGGDHIGSSSYYLEWNDLRILLDCGAESNNSSIINVQKTLGEDFNKLNAIIISHAHKDHYGGLFNNVFSDSHRIISTPITKQKIRTCMPHNNLRINYIIETIYTFDYFEVFFAAHGNAQITFLPAGHIDGAAMTLIQIDGKKILYTGDFSLPLSTCEPFIKQTLKLIRNLDILIIEGTNNRETGHKSSIKHARFNELYELIKFTYPQKIFLVHQNENHGDENPLKTKIESEYYILEFIETKDHEIYYLNTVN